MFTLCEITKKGARLWPEHCSMVFDSRRTSYAQLEQDVVKVASTLLSMGLEPGSRVALLAENSDFYMKVMLGVMRAGCVPVPLNYRLSAKELFAILENAKPSLIVFDTTLLDTVDQLERMISITYWCCLDSVWREEESFQTRWENHEVVNECPNVKEDDLAIIVYTGGTTGQSKGVMISHRNALTAFNSQIYHFNFRQEDIACQALPLFHVAFWPTFCHLMVGATTVVISKVTPINILKTIQDERCTNLNLVPTVYAMILNELELQDYDLSSLRLLSYGGSPFPVPTLKRAIEKFGPIFVGGYGLTEASPSVAFLGSEFHQLSSLNSPVLASAGREMSCVEVQIDTADGQTSNVNNPGEILVSGANVMMGYWGNTELTAEKVENGWLHTGDIGYLDEAGFIYLLDRKADMIVSGGENVYPAEVESVLLQHEAVLECAVVAKPDDVWGEAVCAVIVLRDGFNTDAEALKAHCKEYLATYKVPKLIEIWVELPKSTVGKILRREVRGQINSSE